MKNENDRVPKHKFICFSTQVRCIVDTKQNHHYFFDIVSGCVHNIILHLMKLKWLLICVIFIQENKATNNCNKSMDENVTENMLLNTRMN